MRIGFLHTAPPLAATFEELLSRERPQAQALHVVDSWLLATAIADGVTEAVHDRAHQHMDYLAGQGASAVLVTCSSIGETIEAHGADVPVLRVDAAMAAAAVEIARAPGAGGRIAVLATVQSTLGPTRRLLQRSAGTELAIEAVVVPGAAHARAAGDQDGHDQAIRVSAAAADADVIVLAQASMAGAVAGADLTVPVLTSPELGLRALFTAIDSAEDL